MTAVEHMEHVWQDASDHAQEAIQTFLSAPSKQPPSALKGFLLDVFVDCTVGTKDVVLLVANCDPTKALLAHHYARKVWRTNEITMVPQVARHLIPSQYVSAY